MLIRAPNKGQGHRLVVESDLSTGKRAVKTEQSGLIAD